MSAVKIQFFGDLSLNGTFCDPQYYDGLQKSLEGFAKEDFRVVNWEAPITSQYYFNPLKKPAIATILPSASLFLENFKVDLACLGNNHIGDCFVEGLNTTIGLFKTKSVDYYGAENNRDRVRKPKVFKIKDKNFGFLSYVGEETNPKIYPKDSVFINYIEENRVFEDVEYLKGKVDFIVLTLHWGIEYNQYPSMKQRIFAKKCIDSGVNVIIGHHSHTLQGVEKYKDGLIFYSLGNFIFSGLKGRESYGWPSFCQPAGFVSINFGNNKLIDFEFSSLGYSNYGIKILNETQKKRINNQFLNLSKAFTYKNFFYIWIFRINALKIWGILLPIFILRSSGGLISFVKKYFKVNYFKIVLKYFK